MDPSELHDIVHVYRLYNTFPDVLAHASIEKTQPNIKNQSSFLQSQNRYYLNHNKMSESYEKSLKTIVGTFLQKIVMDDTLTWG